MTIYRPRRPLKYVPRDCTCDGLRVRIKFMGLYGRPLLALAGFLFYCPDAFFCRPTNTVKALKASKPGVSG